MIKSKITKFNEYAIFTASLDVKPTWKHLFTAIVEELGEIASIYKRNERDGTPIDRDKLQKELGDLYWSVIEFSRIEGFWPQDVVDANVTKLESRKNRGVISGSGDDR